MPPVSRVCSAVSATRTAAHERGNARATACSGWLMELRWRQRTLPWVQASPVHRRSEPAPGNYSPRSLPRRAAPNRATLVHIRRAQRPSQAHKLCAYTFMRAGWDRAWDCRAEGGLASYRSRHMSGGTVQNLSFRTAVPGAPLDICAAIATVRRRPVVATPLRGSQSRGKDATPS